MLTGLYSAGTAMQAATRQHEVIAQNLAHAHMPGYRRVMIRHASFDAGLTEEQQNPDFRSAMGTHTHETQTDFSIGPLERTDDPLDIALQGDGFFVIEGENGPLYTRNGSFHLDADGQLVTIDQLPVLGTSGPISIPSNAAFSSLHIAHDGTVSADGQEVGRIRVADFADRQQLRQVGATLFEAPPDVEPFDVETSMLQGTREGANVSPIQELVELINAQRRQEAAQRSMTLLSESVSKNIGLR